MGSSFYTYRQAANRLGVTRRTIHNYVRKGLIKKHRADGETLLSAEDVEEVARGQGTDLPAMNRKTFVDLSRRLEKVEQVLEVVKRALDIRDNPLRLSPEGARALHGHAVLSLASKEWSLEEASLWAEQIELMDEVTLKNLADAIGDMHAWRVFFRLSIELSQMCADKNLESPALEWQILEAKLGQGRKNLRSAVLVWIESGNYIAPEEVFELVDSKKDSLIRKMGKKR